MKIIRKIPYRKIIEGVILFVVAIIALLVLLSYLKVGGLRMYAVKSGSMEPEIMKGNVVFTQPAQNYAVGDVITYQISNGTDFITHRVTEVGNEADKVYYKTKGDANSSEDFGKVTEDKVVGKVTLNVPYVGYFIQYVKTLPGLVILIIIPATIIIYEEAKKIRKEAKAVLEKRRAKKKDAKKTATKKPTSKKVDSEESNSKISNKTKEVTLSNKSSAKNPPASGGKKKGKRARKTQKAN